VLTSPFSKVILGCLGTLSSLLLVGFAQNFWVALAGRILGGALNGNIGVIQTMWVLFVLMDSLDADLHFL
jgi:hypothetical protein